MSETDIRYYVIPTVIVFILGIAAENIANYPTLGFFVVASFSIVIGVFIGSIHQLVSYLWKNLSWLRKKEKPTKRVQTQS